MRVGQHAAHTKGRHPSGLAIGGVLADFRIQGFLAKRGLDPAMTSRILREPAKPDLRSEVSAPLVVCSPLPAAVISCDPSPDALCCYRN